MEVLQIGATLHFAHLVEGYRVTIAIGEELGSITVPVFGVSTWGSGVCYDEYLIFCIGYLSIFNTGKVGILGTNTRQFPIGSTLLIATVIGLCTIPRRYVQGLCSGVYCGAIGCHVCATCYRFNGIASNAVGIGNLLQCINEFFVIHKAVAFFCLVQAKGGTIVVEETGVVIIAIECGVVNHKLLANHSVEGFITRLFIPIVPRLIILIGPHVCRAQHQQQQTQIEMFCSHLFFNGFIIFYFFSILFLWQVYTINHSNYKKYKIKEFYYKKHIKQYFFTFSTK